MVHGLAALLAFARLRQRRQLSAAAPACRDVRACCVHEGLIHEWALHIASYAILSAAP